PAGAPDQCGDRGSRRPRRHGAGRLVRAAPAGRQRDRRAPTAGDFASHPAGPRRRCRRGSDTFDTASSSLDGLAETQLRACPPLGTDPRDGPTGRTHGTDPRDGPTGRTHGTDPRDGPTGRTHGTDPRDGPTGRTHGTDPRDGPTAPDPG